MSWFKVRMSLVELHSYRRKPLELEAWLKAHGIDTSRFYTTLAAPLDGVAIFAQRQSDGS